jgi:hypothetical protein
LDAQLDHDLLTAARWTQADGVADSDGDETLASHSILYKQRRGAGDDGPPICGGDWLHQSA